MYSFILTKLLLFSHRCMTLFQYYCFFYRKCGFNTRRRLYIFCRRLLMFLSLLYNILFCLSSCRPQGGDAKLLVMLCVSPTQRYITESLQTLGLGTRARQVQKAAPRKKNSSPKAKWLIWEVFFFFYSFVIKFRICHCICGKHLWK